MLRIFTSLKSPSTSAGFEPANLGSRGEHVTLRPPRTIRWLLTEQKASDSIFGYTTVFLSNRELFNGMNCLDIYVVCVFCSFNNDTHAYIA